ncbi:MAG: corrinoid protein [Lachnospiraceae bacterium]|nr:corrinoid protein [Lachnospiraceae bacterium]
MYSNEELLCYEELKQAVVDMEDDDAIALSHQIIESGYSVEGAIEQALIAGMEEVGDLYDQEEYFIPDLLCCADTMNASLDILKTQLQEAKVGYGKNIVIGTVLGDTHDIGKNVVACFLESAGFTVHDIGRDISAQDFMNKAIEYDADIIVLSTIMTTTMDSMADVIDLLKENRVRDRFKVMVGGKPVSPKFAKEIGADGYSVNAGEAIKLAKKLAGVQ